MTETRYSEPRNDLAGIRIDYRLCTGERVSALQERIWRLKEHFQIIKINEYN